MDEKDDIHYINPLYELLSRLFTELFVVSPLMKLKFLQFIPLIVADLRVLDVIDMFQGNFTKLTPFHGRIGWL